MSVVIRAENPNGHCWATTVVSFELAAYAYSNAVKAHIVEYFPGRHTLIQGDSHIIR